MGATWLHDLPRWIADWGLPVETHPGWELRSRSSGGYEGAPRGIGGHHDALGAHVPDWRAEAAMWDNAKDRPIGALRVRRSGVIVVGAAGATNTQGRGGPLVNSKGQVIPLNQGNLYLVAIEAANDGVGEPWPADQLENYPELVACLCHHLDLDAGRDYWGHAGYCAPSTPGRKIDPAGPTPAFPELGGTSGARTWPDAEFRRLAAERQRRHELPPITPPTHEEDDVLIAIVKTADGPYSAAWSNGTTTVVPSASLNEFREIQRARGATDAQLKVKVVSAVRRRAYGPLVTVLPDWSDPYGVAL